MKDLDQFLAERINALRDRDGHFVKGRPKITAILDEDHLAERMAYTHTQAVHHHLVERVEEWPGLSSFRAVCEGKESVLVHHLDEAAWREAGAKQSELADHTTTVAIPIAMPASWAAMSPRALREARRAHEEHVRARERAAALERRAAGRHRRLPKPSHHTKIDPFSRPTDAARAEAKAKGPKPWAHGTAEAVEAYCAAYDAMLAAYRVASARFRATGKLCAFPAGTPPQARTSSGTTSRLCFANWARKSASGREAGSPSFCLAKCVSFIARIRRRTRTRVLPQAFANGSSNMELSHEHHDLGRIQREDRIRR